jgi:hypothetical protein
MHMYARAEEHNVAYAHWYAKRVSSAVVRQF